MRIATNSLANFERVILFSICCLNINAIVI
jgi:hypothetical protein